MHALCCRSILLQVFDMTKSDILPTPRLTTVPSNHSTASPFVPGKRWMNFTGMPLKKLPASRPFRGCCCANSVLSDHHPSERRYAVAPTSVHCALVLVQ